MDKILHDPKDPKLWELWYIPYNGSCRILSINSRSTWRLGGLSKSVVSRVLVGVIPFRVLITLLITDLLSPLGL